MRFRTLLSISLIVPLAVTGAAVMAAMYINADRHSTEMAHKLLASVTARAGQEVYGQSEQAVGLARALEQLGPDGLKLKESDTLALQLANILRDHPNITWVSFSNPAGDFTGAYRRDDGTLCLNQSKINEGKTSLIEHTVDEKNQKTFLRAEADTGYDPRKREFYKQAVGHHGLVWVPPYIFFEQSIPGISCAVPVYSKEDALLGVFTVDYDLNYLSDLVGRLKTSERSQVMVFNVNYLLFAHSAVRVKTQSGQREAGKVFTPNDVADSTTKALVDQLKKIDLRKMTDSSQSFSFNNDGRAFVAHVMPMQMEASPILFVATVAPKSDFAPSAWESSKYAFLIVLLAFAGAGALAMILARRISAPITTLAQATEEIGAGNLEVSVSLGSIREFRKLSGAFHQMLANLRDSARARSSLALAREIQRRLLPSGPPQIPGFDIAGFVAYCDETGGDYYDYIPLPADPGSVRPPRFLVVLGDMMGHGLPAALMMAGARGALRSAVSTCRSPARLLTHMNDLFYRDTDGKRFMTMCLLSFDLERGELLWASAGHDPPIIFDPIVKGFHEPQGGDVPLGVLECVPYVDYRFDAISVGQIFFIGSDGVWETTSPEGEQFGKERLQHVMSVYADRGAEEIKSAILQALELYRNGAPVRDDVTFIVLKVLPLTSRVREAVAEGDAAEVLL